MYLIFKDDFLIHLYIFFMFYVNIFLKKIIFNLICGILHAIFYLFILFNQFHTDIHSIAHIAKVNILIHIYLYFITFIFSHLYWLIFIY